MSKQKGSPKRARLTDKLVRALEPPITGNSITWDDTIKGFGIRVTAAGARSFLINYRNAEGILKRLTIGSYGRDQWSVEAARKRASQLKKQISLGDDPLTEKRKLRESETMIALCDRYIEVHLPRKSESSQKSDLVLINNVIKPSIGKRKVAGIEYNDIDKLHRSLKETPYRANRCMALLSKMFNLAKRWHLRSDNPCQGIEKFPEYKRERYLTSDERARLLIAMQEHADKNATNRQTVNALRLAMGDAP